jgi:hypothetical protein
MKRASGAYGCTCPSVDASSPCQSPDSPHGFMPPVKPLLTLFRVFNPFSGPYPPHEGITALPSDFDLIAQKGKRTGREDSQMFYVSQKTFIVFLDSCFLFSFVLGIVHLFSLHHWYIGKFLFIF